jgi:hypothetical protein
MPDKKLYLANDRSHFLETHERWISKFPFNRSRFSSEYEYQDEWPKEQCFTCQYYIALSGRFQSDWGVCSNPSSNLDGRIMFEHDGCEHHSFAADEEDF